MSLPTCKDAVRVPAREWDRTPKEQRKPYVEMIRKDGWVYAVREEQP